MKMPYLRPVQEPLDVWLGNCPDSDFPSNGPLYKLRYGHIAKHLEQYHDAVEKGAIFSAIKEGKYFLEQIPYLNNHGVGHVQTVIKKATQLLQEASCEITPYEGYLLLFAIQLHDIGNIFGRDSHETRCRVIMNDLGEMAGLDKPEKRTVAEIASVHGGLLNGGDKDTISKLAPDPQALLGQHVRLRLLAAILRLSDELADDSSRAAALEVAHGMIPDDHPSLLCQLYSQSLHSVMVKKDEIELGFEMDEDMGTKRFVKNGKSVFLLDEIYSRVFKMYTELVYCMRFMRPDFEISRIRMEIEIYPSNTAQDPLRIQDTLQESGYPSHGNIYNLCPRLKDYSGSRINQQILSKRGPS